MLNEELKEKLRENLSDYNVESLITYMEELDVPFYKADLRGPLAMATFYGVYIDFSRVMNPKLMFFIILHETAHIKRMRKLGKEEILRNLSLEDFDAFFEHVVQEEQIADRYASYIYQKLNKDIYPSVMTQELHLEDNKIKYRQTARGFFGRIQNDEEKYKKFVEQFIIKKY
jgi:hypothetical protein